MCEWFSGTGKGGQRRNKVKSCCRLTHIPSGIIKTAQTRSRESSFNQAKMQIEILLDNEARSQVDHNTNIIRTTQISQNVVRSYNFKRNIVEHGSNNSMSLKLFFKGQGFKLWK